MFKGIITLIFTATLLYAMYLLYDTGFDAVKDYINSKRNCSEVGLSNDVLKVTCKVNSYNISEIKKINMLHSYMVNGYKLIDFVK